MLVVNTLDTNTFRTCFAEVLDKLGHMPRTRDRIKGAHHNRDRLFRLHKTNKLDILFAVVQSLFRKRLITNHARRVFRILAEDLAYTAGTQGVAAIAQHQWDSLQFNVLVADVEWLATAIANE